MFYSKLKSNIAENIKLKKNILKNIKIVRDIKIQILSRLQNKGKVFICGNGGSAADAQHLAAEFLVRLRPEKNRDPYPVVALAMDTSTLTACANDYGYKYIFSRPLKALATKKDILIAISTSGNSQNIITALKEAKKMGIYTIGFLGSGGGKCKKLCDIKYIVESRNVARIQETHIFLGHFIFEMLEDDLIK